MKQAYHNFTAGPMLALVGPWILNKGDDLMLRSVLEHFRGTPLGTPVELWSGTAVPDALIPMGRRLSSAEIIQARGRSPARTVKMIAKGALYSLPPRAALRLSGRVGVHHATGLMDCSGFAYGDAWTTRRMEQRRAYYAALRRRGTRIVLLPQALGPFEKPEMREAARALLGLCDLVFARDADSFDYLSGLDLGSGVALRQCPDITHLLEGAPPSDPDAWRQRVCIVPNMRMMDRTTRNRAAAYLDFLVDAADLTRSLGLEPWIVLHETNDEGLIRSLNDRLDVPLPVINEDAVSTKGILGCCHAVIGSRYHALVSCLSQGTPAIGTSWSHKYDRLFEEYGHDAFLLPPEADRGHREERIRTLLEEPGRTQIAERLGRIAKQQKAKVSQMWTEVDAVLGIRASGRRQPEKDSRSNQPVPALTSGTPS